LYDAAEQVARCYSVNSSQCGIASEAGNRHCRAHCGYREFERAAQRSGLFRLIGRLLQKVFELAAKNIFPNLVTPVIRKKVLIIE
jgi:hypothetical protein